VNESVYRGQHQRDEQVKVEKIVLLVVYVRYHAPAEAITMKAAERKMTKTLVQRRKICFDI
jgi:hypothetical protein